MAATAILMVMISEFGTFWHDGRLFLGVSNRIIAENDLYFVPDLRLMTSCELTSGYIFGHACISAWSCSIFVPNFVQIGSFSTEIFAFYEIQYGRRLPSWSCWRRSWDHPRRPIRLSSIQVINIWICYPSGLKVLLMGPKCQFLGFDSQNLLEHRSIPKRHILARHDAFWAVVDAYRTRRVVALCIYTGISRRQNFRQFWGFTAPYQTSQENPIAKGTPLTFSRHATSDNRSILECGYIGLYCYACHPATLSVNWLSTTSRQQEYYYRQILYSLLLSHFDFLFIPCGGLSWLPVSFLLHVKYTVSYRIVSLSLFLS